MLIRLLDILTVVVVGWYLVPNNASNELQFLYARAELASVFLTLIVFSLFGVYHFWLNKAKLIVLRQVFIAWTSVVLIVATLFFLFKVGEQVSRFWLLAWWLGGLLLMWFVRIVVYSLLGYMRRSGANHKRVVLLGEAGVCERVTEQVLAHPYAGYEVAKIMTLDQVDLLSTGLPGDDELWLLLPLSQAHHIEPILNLLSQCTVNLRWLPDDSSLLSVWQVPKDLLGMTALDLRVSPMSEPANLVIKALEDRILAAMILLLISPFMLVLAFGVKVSSSGPVFYRQQRHGWNGEAFEMLKFRSMVVHTEDNGQVTQATKGDARITPFGAFLRRTSLDELPQFINVLKGDMSIVGPRPHAVAHNDYYSEQIDGYMLRHKMKPGITGWAQVNGWRGETDTLDKMQKRVEYDLWYIEHWSLWLDIKIIIMTIFKGFVHSNAR
ncbi:MAG: undecaprenyl-phosphate glucose phosphotransferase [Thiotrichales bacterium]|jgi:putative colanic acid biosynthesis UDP-glucose lipid carrier transferase|nr:undecaprenyl-phosphate glucose phosphotransferase [Thiotrichales bacterium]